MNTRLLITFLGFCTLQYCCGCIANRQRERAIMQEPGDDTEATPSASAEAPLGWEAERAAVGSWRGTYKCGQGMTGLDLLVEQNRGSGLVAEFYFYAVPGNPGVPSGRFRMSGSVTPAGVVRLLASDDEWIDRPPGYIVVGLTGSISSEGTMFTGEVVEGDGRPSAACSAFTLVRQQ
ncbi:MAG: hypothetical protein HY825_16055 [Acidobacteria bacterium]|nr:hypothetical protein [Acidobacteriota bacterium]